MLHRRLCRAESAIFVYYLPLYCMRYMYSNSHSNEQTSFFPACMRLSRRFDTMSWTPSTCVEMQPGEFTVLGIEYIVPSSLGTKNSKVLRQGLEDCHTTEERDGGTTAAAVH